MAEINLMQTLSTEISSYFKKKDEVVAVYLFGSYAQGRERAGSDVDVGVLLHLHNREALRSKRTQYLTELGRVLRKDMHIVILNTAGEELLRQVFAKGKCVLIKDRRELARFKMVMFSRIANFDYYRRSMQAGLVKKVMEEVPIG